MSRKNKFGPVKSRSKEEQMKDLRKALVTSLKGRKEEDIPETDVYWEIKKALNK
jgi:hypothetical protein